MRGKTAPVLVVAALIACSACGGGAEAALSEGLEAHAAGRLDEAMEKYTQVLEDDPSNKFAHYNLGLIHQTRGRTASASSEYRKALADDPRFVAALFNLAVLLTEAQPREAIALYRQVVEIQPDYAAAHLNLGFLLIGRGDEEEGERELDRAVELDPSLEKRIPSSPSPGPPATPEP